MYEKILRLREQRESEGLERKDLANAMGVTQKVIQEWEEEIYLPKVRQLPALAEALNCTISELFAAH